MENPNVNNIYDRYVNLKHEHSLLQEEVERLRKHQAESIGFTREDWFRRIEEAVQHRDWKRRLFGKKSYYRKYKRQYGDRCRDCKWNPMLKKSLTAEHEKGAPEKCQGDLAHNTVTVVPLDIHIVFERSFEGSFCIEIREKPKV